MTKTPDDTITLPADIEKKIAACEALVDADTARIDETLESLDGTPEEIFEGDTSIVRHVEDVRRTARAAHRTTTSIPPATHAVHAKAR